MNHGVSEGLEIRMRRLRTELAFLYGETRHGGPLREAEMEALRKQLRELEQEKEGIRYVQK